MARTSRLIRILIGAILASPGIVVAVLAFGAFESVYGFIPVSDVIALTAFAVAFATLILLGQRGFGWNRETEILAPFLIGLLLGAWGMGAWKLASLGLALFPVTCLLAYEGVRRARRAAMSKDTRPLAVVATLASLFLLLPSFLATQALYSRVVYLPELLRQVVLASFMSLTYTCTILGLAVASGKSSFRSTPGADPYRSRSPGNGTP